MSGQSGSAGYVRGESGGVAWATVRGHDGTVYRNTGGGWQQNSGSGWGNVSESTRTQTLNHEQQVRSSGVREQTQSAGG